MTTPSESECSVQNGKDAPGKSQRNSIGRKLFARWKLYSARIPRPVKILIVTIVGVLLIAIGLVTSIPGIPGPGSLILLAGLAVLASEYVWARNLLNRCKALWNSFREKYWPKTAVPDQKNK